RGLAGSGEVDDGVDALVLLLDLVCKPALAPDIDVVHRTAIVGDDLQELVERGSNLALVDLRVQNDHEFVLVRHLPTSFGLERFPGLSRKQEGVCTCPLLDRRMRADEQTTTAVYFSSGRVA